MIAVIAAVLGLIFANPERDRKLIRTYALRQHRDVSRRCHGVCAGFARPGKTVRITVVSWARGYDFAHN